MRFMVDENYQYDEQTAKKKNKQQHMKWKKKKIMTNNRKWLKDTYMERHMDIYIYMLTRLSIFWFTFVY